MNIYVGNLTPDTTEDELRQAFDSLGEISSVKIIRDGATGESRGFGFIEMPSEDQAKADRLIARAGTDQGRKGGGISHGWPFGLAEKRGVSHPPDPPWDIWGRERQF